MVKRTKNELLMTGLSVIILNIVFASINISFADVAKTSMYSPQEWGKEFTDIISGAQPKPPIAAFLSRCAVIKKEKGLYRHVPVSSQVATLNSTLDSTNEDDFELATTVNRVFNADLDESSNASSICQKSAMNAAECLQVDCIIDATVAKWRVFRYRSAERKITKVFEAQEGGSSYFSWLQSNLNYDAVILDQKDEFILALLPSKPLPTQTQALVVANSASRIKLSEEKTLGTTLLQLTKQQGRLGIFQIVLDDSEKGHFPLGTKLILEKRPGKANVSGPGL